MNEVERYFARLHERVAEAVDVPFEKVPGCESTDAHCHENVDGCVATHPSLTAVRGWLMEGPDELGTYRVIAHSVLSEGDRLFDITAIDPVSARPKFLRHEGTEKQFQAMKDGRSWLYYPPLRASFDPVSDECDGPQD